MNDTINSTRTEIIPTSIKLERRKTEELIPHPLNHEIYGNSIDNDLLESIKAKGLLNPLFITNQNVIISGHSRLYACQQIGATYVDVIVSEITDEIDIEEAVIVANKQRHKTNEQIAREFTHLKKIEEKKAEKRRDANLKKGDATPDMENFPARDKGNSRDIAASQLGISGKTGEKAAKVIEVIDSFKASGKEEEAVELKESLNKSVDGAFKKVKSNNNEITGKEQTGADNTTFSVSEENGIFIAKANNPDYKSVFNQTNDSIEWAKWSWNPVTGCLHGCPYCYAKNIAENERYAAAFPKKFKPTFHPDRLQAPKNTKIPESRKDEIGIKNVFVCSMADLFGDWMPSDIIYQVFEVCRENKQFNYLFLTKNPARYAQLVKEKEGFEFSDNCWLGATADTHARFVKAYEAFTDLEENNGGFNNIKFLSCEPLQEELLDSDYDDLIPFNWIIIGGMKNSENKDTQPKWEWVESILKQAWKDDRKIYFKPNLTVRPKEYPES